MDTQVFKLIHSINCEGWDNSTWDILHSDGSVHTSEYFGAVHDQVLPEGDYIAVWLKRGSSKQFIAHNAKLCWSVISLQRDDPNTTIYIYKV